MDANETLKPSVSTEMNRQLASGDVLYINQKGGKILLRYLNIAKLDVTCT